MDRIKAWLKAAAELSTTWFCNYCQNGYETYAEMAACMDRCYRERYGK